MVTLTNDMNTATRLIVSTLSDVKCMRNEEEDEYLYYYEISLQYSQVEVNTGALGLIVVATRRCPRTK